MKYFRPNFIPCIYTSLRFCVDTARMTNSDGAIWKCPSMKLFTKHTLLHTLSRFHHTNHNDLLLFRDQKGNPWSGQIWRGSVVDVVPFPRKVLGLSLYHGGGRSCHSGLIRKQFYNHCLSVRIFCLRHD